MDYKGFKKSDNKIIENYNLEEIRGLIVDNTWQIEVGMDEIITNYIKPEKKDVFKRIILNSSIMPLGSKIKILSNIDGFEKKIISNIQRLTSIRNAFVHIQVNENVSINLNKISFNSQNKEDDKVTSKSWQTMDVMNSNGVIITKQTTDLAKEFFQLYTPTKSFLNNFGDI